jgi:hypothetical protein
MASGNKVLITSKEKLKFVDRFVDVKLCERFCCTQRQLETEFDADFIEDAILIFQKEAKFNNKK